MNRSIIPIFIQILKKLWELWTEIEAAFQSMDFIALILKKKLSLDSYGNILYWNI